MKKLLRVLIVEDIEDHAELLVNALERGGYDPIVQRVDTAAAMNAALDSQQWDLVLADYSLPQFSAIAALKLLQARGLDLPFIIVSGTIGEETAVAAMKAGAHDYLMKGKLTRLLPAVERELKEAQVRIERRVALEQLKYHAYYDSQTGLPNRTSFIECLRLRIEREQNQESSLFAVLLLDLDRYKMVKYSFGHILAEELLVKVACQLESCLGYSQMVARLGEDEFGILLTDIQEFTEAEIVAQKIHHALKSPFHLEDGPVVYSSTSIGIVLSTIGYHQPEDFLRAADTAMHYAKVQGRKSTAVFNRHMQAAAINRLQLETDLQQAIKCQQLHLNYQPIISLSTNKLAGFEALVRWWHPSRGLVPPSEFIPLAEETGLIVPLGQWVLGEACRRFSLWQEKIYSNVPLTISVNLSGIQLFSPDLLPFLDDLLPSLRFSATSLKLEITESILMANADWATAKLEQLKKRKIQLCIDDFGTGYSSLSYLNNLPIDTLKIDRSFIACMESSKKNFDIIKTVIALAHILGLDVIAEGVETRQQLALLGKLGCEYGQGYFFSKPLDHDRVSALMTVMNNHNERSH